MNHEKETNDWEKRFDKAFPRDHDLFAEGKTKVKSLFKETLQRTRLETIEAGELAFCRFVEEAGLGVYSVARELEKYRSLVESETLKNLRALKEVTG